MSPRGADPEVVRTIEDILRQLRNEAGSDVYRLTSAAGEPLYSLLDQCRAISDSAEGPEPLRTIHHFACTGGTVVSRILGALPNVAVLSEIDPLSLMQIKPGLRKAFAPTDLIMGLRQSAQNFDDAFIAETFLAGLEAAKANADRIGLRLVLRDHAHSQFCVANVDPDARPTLLEILRPRFALRSVVTVRHPLDSFLSLVANNWVHFGPPDIEAYAVRYAAFLDRHAGLRIFHLEDIAREPEASVRALCAELDLPFLALSLELFSAIPMTGNSGRITSGLGLAPRRPVPARIESDIASSEAYAALCDRLGYPVR